MMNSWSQHGPHFPLGTFTMASLKALTSVALTLAVLAPHAAVAADIPLAPPPLIAEPEPLPIPVAGGWYLRGHIGVSNQKLGDLDNALFATTTVTITKKDFDSAFLAGGGVGYQFNKWLRADATAEYRFKSKFKGFDSYDDGLGLPGSAGTNDYTSAKSEILLLANAYVDLGTWYGFTPYLGAGIGTSRNTIHGLVDVNVPQNGLAYAGSDSKWNFAWALYAGFGYQISPNLTLDVAYRYINLGDGQTKDIIASDGTNAIYNPMYFKDITSHDIMVGLRYSFGHRMAAAPELEPLTPLAPLEPAIVKH
jgi:opacity protein-like surface antigen